MKRVGVFAVALVAYAVFFGTFLYLPAFVGNLGVPKGIDSGMEGSLVRAFLVDGGLILLFSVQHTIMARPWFKASLTKWVPKPMERSVFVLAASSALILLFWLWRPVKTVVWSVEHPVGQLVFWSIFAAGYLMALYSSFLIDHFELFGLRQAWNYVRGRVLPEPQFTVKSLYRYMRHPLMAGILLLVWSAPTMTVGHLFFAAILTSYVFVGIAFEERDLLRYLGKDYERYRERTPMLLPMPPKSQTGDRCCEVETER